MTGRRIQSRGFTLVEAAISIVLVSVLLVAALNTMGAARLGQRNTLARGRAHLLAEDLMAEIMRQSYADPESVGFVDLTDPSLIPSGLTIDSGESGGSRIDFDDVDDYHGWTATPPEQKDGTTIPNLTGWTRSVSIERLDPATRLLAPASELGLKRITVTVAHDGALVTELVGFKGAGLPP
jgi:prepilin-type N-terminal cleavage/methylation domain-containing protein